MRLAGGVELEAHAEYLFAEEQGRLAMLFPEPPPRLFQNFALEPEDDAFVGDSIHNCPPDLYRSRIAFAGDGGWSLTHRVTGPRKAYVSTTVYSRA